MLQKDEKAYPQREEYYTAEEFAANLAAESDYQSGVDRALNPNAPPSPFIVGIMTAGQTQP